MKFLFDDGNQNVGRYGAPDLRLDGVLAVAQKLLDAKVLFDPFEEQFDLPTILVKRGDCQWWQYKIVGQEYEGLSCLGVFETNAAQILWVMLSGIKAVERHRLIADHSRTSVGALRVDSFGVHVCLGASDKERIGQIHCVESFEIQIPAIHDIKGAWLGRQEVEHVDFVHLAVADMDKRWDGATQIQQRMQLDCSLGFAKWGPVEQTQTKVDRRCVQRINRVLQIQADQVGVAVQFACALDQQGGYVGPNVPVARLVGVGQRRATYRVAQAHRVQFVRIGAKRYLDVAQALAPRQLRKRHHTELFCTAQTANARVAAVTIDNPTKARPRHELHNLRKQRLADIHEKSPRG